MSEMSRRKLLTGALVGAGGIAAAPWVWKKMQVLDQPMQRVSAFRAESYDADLTDILIRGLAEYPHVIAKARGGRVVLKPNLVEYSDERPVNTNSAVMSAAIAAFRAVGAREVVVAEGPGHRRDTEILVENTGLRRILDGLEVPFIDLNVDDVRAMTLPANFTGFGQLMMGRTVLDADLFVSVAKLKTHHWAGATLTMKNLFGTVPGSVYGWPKNPLHYKGIDRSILDLWHAIQPGFGIIDGIVGMEGDGPIMGSAKASGVMFMGDHLPALDATAVRFMSLVPERMQYLKASTQVGATIAASRIQVVGDRIDAQVFDVVDRFNFLRA
ncbi:MAG: hypothetical protein ACJAZO_002914 [Myxococcota bacterium]|jgi:uncharacterized protein (DUF362 family)